jgi:Tol biopolymer transport system component
MGQPRREEKTAVISDVAIYEIDTGRVRSVLRSDQHIEAPNWLPDGRSLLVNSAGRLYRLPLDAPRLDPVDTGFARMLNNDHGPSPDGTRIAISDKTETGQSCIYTLPIGGGTPRRVTENTPSYFHGWSPDGQAITYPAFRGAEAEIHTCPAEGGPETRITSGFDHCDGPEYTPDGAWIWFNGEKDGAVDLWRTRPDGRDLERMTCDETVNWFPHPSPDGRHILYMAYPPGTEGHPANHDVELRLMPAEGGASRRLLSLFGGQGTINGPCWASDASRFSFVRYEHRV